MMASQSSAIPTVPVMRFSVATIIIVAAAAIMIPGIGDSGGILLTKVDAALLSSSSSSSVAAFSVAVRPRPRSSSSAAATTTTTTTLTFAPTMTTRTPRRKMRTDATMTASTSRASASAPIISGGRLKRRGLLSLRTTTTMTTAAVVVRRMSNQGDDEAKDGEAAKKDKDDVAVDEDDRGFYPLRVFGAAVEALFSAPWLGPILFWAPIASSPTVRSEVWNFLTRLAPDDGNGGVTLDLPAIGMLSAVVAGGGVFWSYKRRVEQVGDVAQIKWEALAKLRNARSRQLSLSGSSGGGNGDGDGDGDASTAAAEVEKAAKAYEDALRREIDLRAGGLPFLRITSVPNDPIEIGSEDVAAARQFLGLELKEDGTLVDIKKQSR